MSATPAFALLALSVVGAVPSGAAPATRQIVPSTRLLVYPAQPANRSAARVIVFVNRGPSPELLGPVAVRTIGAAAFALESDTCGSEIAELAAGSACTYTVTFRPPRAGRFRAVLQYGAGGSIVGVVRLAGTAVAGNASLRRTG